MSKLPPMILDLLLKTPVFIEIQEHAKTKGLPLSALNETDFEQAEIEINEAIAHSLEDDPSLKTYLRVGSKKEVIIKGSKKTLLIHISARTIARSFAPEEGKPSDKTLHALLIFLDIDEKEWNTYKSYDRHPHEIDEEKLHGTWWLYYQNENEDNGYKIYGNAMYISAAQEVGLYTGRTLYTGNMTIKNDQLFLDMWGGTKNQQHFQINARVSNHFINDFKPYLIHGILLKYGINHTPYAINCIMVKDEELNLTADSIETRLPIDLLPGQQTMYISERNEDKNRIILDWLYDFQPLTARPFNPNTFDKIKSENAKRLRDKDKDYYWKTKKIFPHQSQWLSFSRIESETDRISFFSWKIEHDELRKECCVSRYRNVDTGKVQYYGKLYCTHESVYLTLKNDQRREKHFMALIEKGSPEKFRGTSNTIFQGSGGNVCVREILCKVENPNELFTQEELDLGWISYERFLQLDILSRDDKRYLNDIEHSRLSYPKAEEFSRRFAKQKKAEDFEGEYFTFITNKYCESFKMSDRQHESLQYLTLTIDEIGGISMNILYPETNGDRTVTYYGFAEYFNHNLRLSLSHDSYDIHQQKHVVMMFNPVPQLDIKENLYFIGSMLCTDRYNFVSAHPFISIRASAIMDKEIISEYKPGVIFKHPKKEKVKFQYQKLNDFLDNYCHTNILQFFNNDYSTLHMVKKPYNMRRDPPNSGKDSAEDAA